MLERYFDAVGNRRPLVTWGLLLLSATTSILAIVEPNLNRLLNGVAPHDHAWQGFTAPFVHGWPTLPAALHLILMTLVVLRAGPPTERLLGRGRFLALCLAAILGVGALIPLGRGTNGLSIVAWAWGPTLWLALRAARAADPEAPKTSALYKDLNWLLVFLYGILPIGFTLLVYLRGYRGAPFEPFFRANVYHLLSLGVGVLGAAVLSRTIRRRVSEGRT